jgi:hypothetical protein
MAAGKTLALSLVMVLGVGFSARANGLNSGYQEIWKYWQSRESSQTVLTNHSVLYSTINYSPAVPRYYNAYVNFDGLTYPDAPGLINVGAIAPWYSSPALTRFYGGHVPGIEDRQTFTQGVFEKVRQIFDSSGLQRVSLTSSPTDRAGHTISVISGASYDGSGDILGMTYTGGSGFSFLDNFQHLTIDSAETLELALAKNIAHELMHAFGGDHVHGMGPSIDVAHTTWESLTSRSPESMRFSSEAAGNISAVLDGTQSLASLGLASGERIKLAHRIGCDCTGCGASAQTVISPQPVPEPSTFLFGAVAILGAVVWHRRGRRSVDAA